ncbi:MAG TPA: tRNA pseudouridine(13) synthase TruD, partial [Povalibacter sp.]
AHGAPPIRGRIRVAPEDFVVREWLGFDADGDGDHWLLTVRKRGANTHWVAKQLAKHAQIHVRDVGFAGLKDRNAVTEQAFTVPVRSAAGSDWAGFVGEGFEVIAAQRHRRKLKRGALRGNDFEIIVRDVEGDPATIAARISTVATQGVPNYFGPQRFGIDGGNLLRARQWLGGEIALHDRLERSFALSAARAAIFNTVLARRVADGSWNQLQPGDVANLDGSNSVFRVDSVDEVLRERCTAFDIHPTGPLWGRGSLTSQGQMEVLEQEVADSEPALSAGLAAADLDQERRRLRVHLLQLHATGESGHLHLKFRLPRGAFATAVLHELIEGVFEQGTAEAEEE